MVQSNGHHSEKKHSTKMRGGIYTGDRERLRLSDSISQGHVMAKAPECKRQHEEPLQPSIFGVSRVKAIAKQDESFGTISTEAAAIIARCTEAFLVDLVKASANKIESDRKPDMKRKHRLQVLPEDVQKAAAEEERFDFLRPVLGSPNGNNTSTAGASSKAISLASQTRRKPQKKRAKTEDKHKFNKLAKSEVKLASLAECGTGERADWLALAKLDDEGRRAMIMGGVDDKASAQFGLGEEEDYDN